MSLLIYSIHNCIDKVSIANFEYFISYGLLNNNSIKPNKPITTLIVFVSILESGKTKTDLGLDAET